MGRIDFKASSIPQCQTNSLMNTLLGGMTKYFADPRAEGRYQTWLAVEDNKKRIDQVKQFRKKRDVERRKEVNQNGSTKKAG